MTTVLRLSPDQKTAFQVENLDEVREFIQANPSVLRLISEAIPHIHRKFGSKVRLDLTVLAGAQLLLEVVVSLEVDEARGVFQEFNDEWWRKAEPRAQGKLKIGLGFARRERPMTAEECRILESLSPEVRAGLGLFKDSARGRSAVDELINERREEAARDQ